MILIGIDPGTTSIGYGIIEEQGRGLCFRDAGLIRITSTLPHERLKELQEGLQALITTWKPDVFAVEKLFFTTNQKTAMSVAEARGVILLTIAHAGLTFYEYTPLAVKKTVTGDGKADKTQVKKMVRYTLKDTISLDARDDVFDALAIALTCYFNERNTLSKRSR